MTRRPIEVHIGQSHRVADEEVGPPWGTLGVIPGVDVLMENGTWARRELDHDLMADDGVEPGVVLPRGALEPLLIALYQFVGESLPSQAEVLAVRESLDVERARNDRLVERLIDYAAPRHS